MQRDMREEPASGRDEDRVEALARKAITVLGNKTSIEGRLGSTELQDRIMDATNWLARAIIAPVGFDPLGVLAELERRKLRPIDIVDHCIPEVARLLGSRWVDSELSFAEVTVGSARLCGLLKALAADWTPGKRNRNRLAVLVVLPSNEQHTLGVGVLSEQLRRRGHSVRVLHQAQGTDVKQTLLEDHFDSVMFSCASLEAVDGVAEMIRLTRTGVASRPVFVLGGAILGHEPDLMARSGADVVTNDLSQALPGLAMIDNVRTLVVAQT